jgi:protein-disulfide isomerase
LATGGSIDKEQGMTDQQLSERGRLWLFIGILLAVIGMGVSAYSINHHREVKATGQSDAACNINQTVSCDEVALSEYSEIGRLPLGVFGFGYFAAMAVLAGMGLGGLKSSKEHVHAYVVMVGIGVATSIGLAVISTFIIQKACLVCIGVYVLTILQALTLAVFRGDVPRGFDLKGAFSGGTTAAIVVAVVAAGYTYLLPPVQVVGGSSDQASSASGKPAPALAPEKKDIPVSRTAYAGLGEDYRKGPDDAKVVIVEFADFQCPACKQMDGTLSQIAQEYEGKVQVVFRNYPLDNTCNASIQSKIHDSACKAAVMARCAGQYGKFWPYHKTLFENQKAINEAQLKSWAKDLGLTDDQIAACWDSPDLLAKVKDDIELGNKLGVDATPTIFINGQKVTGGRGLQDLRGQLDLLLN